MIRSKQFVRWRKVIVLALGGVGVGVACTSGLYSTVERHATGDEYGSGDGSDEYGGGDDDGSGDAEYGDAGVGSGDAGSGSDGSVCGDGGTPPQASQLQQALECVALLNEARSSYHDALKAATAGYPLEPSDPTSGPTPTLSELATMTRTPPQDIFGMPDSAQYALYKSQNFEESFFADRVLGNSALYQCTQILAALPMENGYFGPRPTYPQPPYPPPPIPTDPTNTCFNNPPPPPPEPALNCMGVVVVAVDSYNAGEINKNGTEKCEDYSKHEGVTIATRNFGTNAVAFGGLRKEKKQGEEGPDCSQSSPLIQNWEMGVAAKPAGVFVPEQILEQKPGQAAQWVANEKGKMLYYVYPDKDGKPVKRGPTCRQDTQLTVRTAADMHLPYYIYARVYEDPNGKSGRSKAYQAQITVNQRCYGPGTLVSNPGAFAVVPSEQEAKTSLKIVKDCQKEQAWNANVNVGGTMGAQQGGSFGFGGGVTETTRCAENLDIDQFAEGGCFANQNFGNVSMTTKKQNGPFAIGAVFQLFNPNDPNAATAPINFLQMGMKLIGAQARATSSIDSRSLGTGGDGMANILTDRRKWSDKPEKANAKVKLGSGGCSLLWGENGTPRPATECVVPFPDWPFLPKLARDKVPTQAQLGETFDNLVKQIKDAAAR